MTIDTTTAIADEFAAILRSWLRPDEWEEMRTKNRTILSACCASHDYCDANEAMAEAFEKVVGRPHLPEDDSEPTEEDCQLWGDAWMDAKRRHLTAPDAPTN